jgi:hypothetical protein
MKTTDLFKFNRSSKRINESIDKVFGQKLNFETFDTEKLEDARNKLRTQIHTARGESGFNETIENEALTKAQWMHDAIVAELMDREEHIVDNTFQEESEDKETVLGKIADEEDYDALYDLMSDIHSDAGKWIQSQIEDITSETGLHPDDDFEEIENRLMDRIVSDFGEGFGQPRDDEGGDTDDAYALASAGHGSDEDYGFSGHDESVETEGESQHSDVSIAQDVYAENPDLDSEDDILNAAFPHVVKMMGGSKKRANYMFNYDEDFPGEMISAYKWLQRQAHDVGEATGRDAYQRDYDSSVSGMGRQERDWDEGDTEPANNFAVAINGKQWKVFKGRGHHADDMAERNHFRQLKDWAAKKSEATGKKWTVHVTGEPATESVNYENKEQTGDNMSNLREGEIQQASAIVTAKTMVDRVGRWIEELSGMENDTLLTLGDSIRDEMGQEKAKAFISAVAPTIQQALENLKSTRETLSSGVRALTGEEQSAEMLGGEPGAEGGDEFGGDVAAPAEPDAMNAGGDEFGADAGLDDFAAAEPAAGGSEEAGRAKRESIDRSNQLLKVLAG